MKLPTIPKEDSYNARMFYIKITDLGDRIEFIKHMKKLVKLKMHSIMLRVIVYRWVENWALFSGIDENITSESECLVRLLTYYGLVIVQVDYICEMIKDFWRYKRKNEIISSCPCIWM